MDDAATEFNASRPASPEPPLPPPPAAAAATYRFTWDPALRRPGPSSVSEATDTRAADTPRGALFPLPNVSALSLALPHDWSSASHGFNAISTVLNNPHKRAAPPKAHSALPAGAPAELPRVRRRDFEPYLASVAPEWERFERSTRLGRAGAAQLEPVPQPQPQPSTSALSPAPLTADFPRTPRTPQPGTALPALDTVPDVFFDPAFDLGDPRTFALVTESLDDDNSGALDPASIAHALPVLEKLAHYADVVEQHLVREIARRSASFFAALANLQDLQAEAGAGRARISTLRAQLRAVDARTARRGLALVRLEARRANLDRVAAGVRAVRDVGEMVGVAGGLVHAGAWGEALGVVAELDALWAAPEGAAPLPALQAFASLPAHLRALGQEVAAALAADLAAVLRADLRARCGGGGGEEGAGEALRERVEPLLQGLVRTEGVAAALDGWREVVLGEVRGAVKRHLPAAAELDEEDAKKTLPERSASLAQDLRAMAHDDFLALAQRIYASLLRCLHGVQAQSAVLAGALPAAAAAAAGALPDTLAAACELANARAAKVLALRAPTHALLPLPQFHALFAATWAFVLACEVLARRMLVGLRGAAVAQAKGFLGAFHGARLARAARLVEAEQWAPVDVPRAAQATAAQLVDAAVRDPPGFVLPPPAPLPDAGAQPPLSPPSTPPGSTPPPPPGEDGAAPAKQLRVEERAYFVVGATLEVLVELLADYVRLVVNLPLLTTDAMARVIEFLKAFNSRACQVVLGAGAMRSAGLKNITAKHLALASQALSLAAALVPYVRETFRRHLSATQAVLLTEFDRLKRDFQEHQHEIHAKLVAIMGERVGVHCRALQEVRWEEAREGGAGASAYMVVLVKETVTLHKVLAKYLAAQTVELVMTQVLAATNHRLAEEFAHIELASGAAKDRLLQDARYLGERMRGLRYVGGAAGGMLETVVREKRVRGRLGEKMAAAVAGAGGGAGSGGGGGGGGGAEKAPGASAPGAPGAGAGGEVAEPGAGAGSGTEAGPGD